MKKKLFVGTVIPFLAAIAVIGSGFSLWIFGDSNEANAKAEIKIDVTKALGVGEINVDHLEDSSIILDQIGDESSNPNAKGIYVKNPQVANYVFVKDSTKDYKDFVVDYLEGKTNLVFTTTIEIPVSIYEYVDVCKHNMSLDYWVKDYPDEYKVETKENGDKVFTFTDKHSHFDNGLDAITDGYSFMKWGEYHNYSNTEIHYLTVQYRTETSASYSYNKSVTYPKTLAEYKTMREKVNGQKISVKYEAQVVVL